MKISKLRPSEIFLPLNIIEGPILGFSYTCLLYMSGVATLFCLRAKFKNYFSSRSAQFKIVSYDKVTTFARQKKIGLFDAFIDSFWPNFYVAFSLTRKRSKGRKNKLEDHTLAMSVIWCAIITFWVSWDVWAT